MKRAIQITFFLLLFFVSCEKHGSSNKKLLSTDIIDALLVRDTSSLQLVFDSLSIEFLDVFYDIPYISNVKDVHYRFVVSRIGSVLGKTVYRYTVIFPWKEKFTFLIVWQEERVQWLPLFLLNNDFSHVSEDGTYYFYPKYLNKNLMKKHLKNLVRLKGEICPLSSLCPEKITYIYTGGDVKPEFIYSLDRENKPVYRRGLCISNFPEDTLHFLHSLLDSKEYLYPFVRGVYHYYYGQHKSFGFDFGDWIKASFSSSSFRTIAKDLAGDMVFYKPLATPLGYLFIRYLAENRRWSRGKVLKENFTLSSTESQIIFNNGSREIFIKKRVENIAGMSYTKLMEDVVRFIGRRFKDISKKKDTIVISRDRKRNITFIKSSLYKNADDIEVEFKNWLDSIPFFYRPYYNVLLLPTCEIDSFRSYLTPANSYWVPAQEFKKKEAILGELKREYSTFLISDFIRTFSLQESQLPLWFSLGLPMYLECKDTCNVPVEKVFEIGKGDAFSFYQEPVGRILPQQGIILSYYLLRIIDRKHPGKIYDLLERSMSNMNFKKTYNEVTGGEIKEVLSAWKVFIEDTLYYGVSRK